MMYINDRILYRKWQAISALLLSNTHKLKVSAQNMLIVNNQFILAKSKEKMRLVSQLDWVHYTPADLAQAINTNTVDAYYEQQLNDSLSDPNVWKRHHEEMELKSFYAQRSGRASEI